MSREPSNRLQWREQWGGEAQDTDPSWDDLLRRPSMIEEERALERRLTALQPPGPSEMAEKSMLLDPLESTDTNPNVKVSPVVHPTLSLSSHLQHSEGDISPMIRCSPSSKNLQPMKRSFSSAIERPFGGRSISDVLAQIRSRKTTQKGAEVAARSAIRKPTKEEMQKSVQRKVKAALERQHRLYGIPISPELKPVPEHFKIPGGRLAAVDPL
ncbi:hypothetical protein MMC28_009352 [Mycoblastus sanguinarius]|nr:hypothetical protein [Mycoblastus sanguinarius]